MRGGWWSTMGLGLAVGLAAGNVGAEEPQPEPAKATLAEETDGDVVRKVRKLIQATIAADDAERVKGWQGLKEMGNLAVPALIALYRKPGLTPAMLESVLIALGDSKDPRAGPALLELLAFKDAQVKVGAARALGDSGYKEALPALETLAANAEEDEDVRLHAATAGARMGSEKAITALQQLAVSPNAATRSRAIFTLGKHGGAAQLAAIRKGLEDTDRGVREDTVQALTEIGEPALDALIAALNDSDYRVRASVMDGLRHVTKQRFDKPDEWRDWCAKRSK